MSAPVQTQNKFSLASITTKSLGLPSRILVHGQPSIGKTSLPAYAPAPVFVQTLLETGVDSLRDARSIPDSVGTFPEVMRWADLLACVDTLITEDHKYKTLAIDTANGAEKMCHDHVCQRDFNGSMPSFTAYQNGYDVAVQEWRRLLHKLDKLRAEKRMLVIMLAHTKVRNYKNPEGPDYDRYIPDMREQTWSATHGWADMVLFLNFETTVVKEAKARKGKGVDGTQRYMYTERCAAWDAKNRLGLPESISMGSNGDEAWANLAAAIKAAKK